MESVFSARRRDIMEVRMESKKGPVVGGIDPVLAEIQQWLQAHPKVWLKTLERNPGGLANLEQEIQRTFAQMADRVVAGPLALATADSAFADAAKKSNSYRPNDTGKASCLSRMAEASVSVR
jgi:hypothetical protein